MSVASLFVLLNGARIQGDISLLLCVAEFRRLSLIAPDERHRTLITQTHGILKLDIFLSGMANQEAKVAAASLEGDVQPAKLKEDMLLEETTPFDYDSDDVKELVRKLD